MKRRASKKYTDFFDHAKKSLPPNHYKRALKQAEGDITRIRLAELRRVLGVRQTEVSGFTQSNVSRLESRPDMKISTLIQYLKSLGLSLEIRAVDKRGSKEQEIVLLRA